MTGQGSDFGPLAVILAEFSADVIDTLHVLAEIELSRRDRLLHGSMVVERETRSPAQGEIAGTMKRSRTTKTLDVCAVARDDAILK